MSDGSGRVTREMIGAAHDVMLRKGDFILSANMLEQIYLAMKQAAPPPEGALKAYGLNAVLSGG